MSAPPDCPTIVSRAFDVSRRAGYVSFCRNETGRLLAALAATRGGTMAEFGTGCGVGTAWLRSGVRGSTPGSSPPSSTRSSPARPPEIFADDPQVEVLAADWSTLLDQGPFSLLFLDSGEPERGRRRRRRRPGRAGRHRRARRLHAVRALAADLPRAGSTPCARVADRRAVHRRRGDGRARRGRPHRDRASDRWLTSEGLATGGPAKRYNRGHARTRPPTRRTTTAGTRRGTGPSPQRWRGNRARRWRPRPSPRGRTHCPEQRRPHIRPPTKMARNPSMKSTNDASIGSPLRPPWRRTPRRRAPGGSCRPAGAGDPRDRCVRIPRWFAAASRGRRWPRAASPAPARRQTAGPRSHRTRRRDELDRDRHGEEESSDEGTGNERHVDLLAGGTR